MLVLIHIFSESVYAQNFQNGDFEGSSSCSATNCAHTDISCIDDWWNWTHTISTDESDVWYRYDCQESDVCGDERGMRIGATPGDIINPTVVNPLFDLENFSVYVLNLDLLPLTPDISNNPDYYFIVRGSDLANSTNFANADILGYVQVTGETYDCQSLSLSLSFALNGDEAHITEYPFLIFSVAVQIPMFTSEPTASAGGVIDNLQFCVAFDVTVSEETCDELCVTITPNESCANYSCGACYTNITINDGEDDHDEEIEEINTLQNCIPQNESGEYLITVGAEDNNGTLFYHQFPYTVADCLSEDVQSSTTWTTANVPNQGKFDILTIESGSTLTVEEDVVLKFCPGGKLIVEPNAELRLYGKLTSVCDDGWEGVKVYGDNTHNQYYDFVNSQYYQGSLRGFPGSEIENAVTSVELFGPDPEDTGGRISCNGTTFINHEKGVVFKPYNNIVGGIPHQYRGHFADCVFTVDDNYLYGTPFLSHIELTGVNKVVIVASDFINAKTNTSASLLTDFGYGILAMGADFSVSAISPEYPDECDAPCDRSTFTGLGYGVLTTSGDLRNRAFTVNHSDFTNCYVGIGVDGVSAGRMLYNRFYMGEIPDVDVMEGDQLGINLRKGINGFDLEENEFYSSETNTNNTLGIVLDNILDYDNIVRRNTFEDMTISIEAFGENGNPIKDAIEGVMFLCNQNSETDLLDFYIPDEATSGYPVNSINRRQGLSGTDGVSFIATGNEFSNFSPEDYRDFANHGGYNIKYWHYTSDADQILNEYIGVSNVFSGDNNVCGNNHSLSPSPIVIADQRADYLENIAPYLHALSVEEWDTAAMYKSYLDQIALRATQFYLSDTVTYNEDSLLTWYKRMNTPMGHVLGSKLKAAQGNFSAATTFLGIAASAFELTAQGEEDLDSIQSIYSILSVRSVENLIAGDFDRLETIALMPGHASAMARGILSQHGYHFEPEYYLPDEEEFYFASNPEKPVASPSEIYVYPNPFDGELLFVYVPDLTEKQEGTIEVFDATGKRLLIRLLNSKHNQIEFDKALIEGFVFYRVTGDGITSSGTLTVIK